MNVISELKARSFAVTFAGHNINSIQLFGKTVSEISAHVPRSLRRRSVKKATKMQFFIFKQFPDLSECEKEEISRILALAPTKLRAECKTCGFPRDV